MPNPSTFYRKGGPPICGYGSRPRRSSRRVRRCHTRRRQRHICSNGRQAETSRHTGVVVCTTERGAFGIYGEYQDRAGVDRDVLSRRVRCTAGMVLMERAAIRVCFFGPAVHRRFDMISYGASCARGKLFRPETLCQRGLFDWGTQ